jgi:molybdopterin-guanine dinucleotide biosynthesis protein A
LIDRPTDSDVLIVLAGGRSRRFGSDKALADLGDGEPLALRALRRLAPLAQRRVLVRAAPLAGVPGDVQVVADRSPGAGPLQALEAAFAAAPARRWFVAPCDAPALEVELYAPLAAAAGDAGVACARHGGRLEPLVAVFSARAAARLVAEARPAGVESVQRALARLGAATVEFPAEDPRFRNVNTRDEWNAARADAAVAAGTDGGSER